MHYFVLEPEVAGGWGEKTKADTSKHPPVVTHLHYEFDGWLGDELVESFPCFLVTERVAEALSNAGLSGFILDEVETTTSEEYRHRAPALEGLPRFRRLKAEGRAGEADVGVSSDSQLVVSERALSVLKRYTLVHCEVSAWER